MQTDDYGSMEDYLRDLAATGSVLSELQSITDDQVTAEQQMLDSLEDQITATETGTEMIVAGLSQINQSLSDGRPVHTISATSPAQIYSSRQQPSDPQLRLQLQGLRSDLAATQAAIARHTAKTARILERIDIGGLEVRS